MDQLTLNVPASTLTHFVVAASLDVDHPRDLVTRQLRRRHAEGHPLAGEALTLLRSPSVHIETVPAAESGWVEELQDLAGPDENFASWWPPGSTTFVTVSAPTMQQPRTAQLSRLIARTLTRATGGVLTDPCAHIVLADAYRIHEESGSFEVAGDWVTVFLTQDQDTGDTLRAETRGLTRFGLPELCTQGFGQDVSMTAVNLLRGLAVQLLHEHWDHLASPTAGPSRTISAGRAFDIAWVYRYYRRPPTKRGSLAVLVRHLPGSPNADLEVLPPSFMQGSTGRWWRNYAALTIPGLTH